MGGRSFIVLAEQGSLSFETFGSIAGELPGAYKGATESIGFLTINRGELIALDGQHRLLAFREVITGGGGTEHMTYATAVGDDEVCVMFIEFENKIKTRRIFNKVNRNAKPTSTSDNIITSEDDGYAIVTRWLLDPEREAPLAEIHGGDGASHQLVNWTNSALNRNSHCLTTLTAVYDTVKTILAYKGASGFSEESNPVAPSDSALEAGYELATEWWEALLMLSAFREAIANPDCIPDIRFAGDDSRTLLLRPAGQIMLVRGLVLIMERSRGQAVLATLMKRVEKVDWSASPQSFWRDVVVKPDGRMMAKEENYRLGARLIAHLIGAEYETPEVLDELRIDWNEARGRDPFTSIDELDDEMIPEDLPIPVLD